MNIYAVTSYIDEGENKAFTTREKAIDYCYKCYNKNIKKEDDALYDEYEMDIVDKAIPISTTYEEYVKKIIDDNDTDLYNIEKFEVVE